MPDIYCCNCEDKKPRELVFGDTIYPNRSDLRELAFWRCNNCKNHVGCHKSTQNPLGCIATPEIKKARQHIHRILDPIWKSGRIRRNKLYKAISNELGWKYHTAMIKSMDEAREVYKIVRRISKEEGVIDV